MSAAAEKAAPGAVVVYKLKFPVELRSTAGAVVETINELRLRRLKGREMRTLQLAGGSGGVMLDMLAASAGLPPSTVDELDAADITDAGAIVAGFLGGSLPTGGA